MSSRLLLKLSYLCIQYVFLRHNLPVNQLRQQQVLNQLDSPLTVLNSNLSGEQPCETLSLIRSYDKMDVM